MFEKIADIPATQEHTGVLYSTGNGFVTQAHDAKTFVPLDEPTNAPKASSTNASDLKELTVAQQKSLQIVSAGLRNGVQAQRVQLTPDQQKMLDKLNAPAALKDKSWPRQMQAFLRDVDKDGSLAKKMDLAGIHRKSKTAYQYALLVAKDNKPAPQGSKLKKDPKTGQVLSKEQLVTKQGGYIYDSGNGSKGDGFRTQMGMDSTTAQQRRGIKETPHSPNYYKLRMGGTLLEDKPKPENDASKKVQGAGASVYASKRHVMGMDLNAAPRPTWETQ